MAFAFAVMHSLAINSPSSCTPKNSISLYQKNLKKHRYISPVARIFGPAVFDKSKLKVLFLGIDEQKHPGNLPRTYTLTHCDVTSKLTLAISQTINEAQISGWYNKLQRDEVIARWEKIKGMMSLHVHCHISGGHLLHDLIANLRYYIFCKELPVVLKAFYHGDEHLFNNYPELEEAHVWVYFHSKHPTFNKIECWGPLKHAVPKENFNEKKHKFFPSPLTIHEKPANKAELENPRRCQEHCDCCFPPLTSVGSL